MKRRKNKGAKIFTLSIDDIPLSVPEIGCPNLQHKHDEENDQAEAAA